MFNPEPVVRLSDVTGATLYQLSDDQQTLVRIGTTGDVGGKKTYDAADKTSYVSVTFSYREPTLYRKEKLGGQKEYIMCVPIAERYILTLHFLVDLEYRREYDELVIIRAIYQKNKQLFDLFNFYLEKGEEHATQSEWANVSN